MFSIFHFTFPIGHGRGRLGAQWRMTNVILKMEDETGPAVSPLPSERNSNEQNFGGDERPRAPRSNEFARCFVAILLVAGFVWASSSSSSAQSGRKPTPTQASQTEDHTTEDSGRAS